MNEFRYEVIKCLQYIIDRDIDISNMTKDEKIRLDELYHNTTRHNFYVYLNGKFYTVDSYMLVKDAEYILNNIDDIQYYYNSDKGEDTIVGDIRSLTMSYGYNDYWFIKFINGRTSLFTKDDAIEYFNSLKG